MKNQISSLLQNDKSKYILVGLGVVGVGASVYAFTRRRKKHVYFTLPTQVEEPEVHEDIVTEETFEVVEMIDEVDEQEEVRVNVFMAESDDSWDYETELQQRDGSEPYIIHADEYINDEMGYKQDTVTYYEADDIMADISDTPIYNWRTIFGPLEWGHGSKDKNVVYIRNENMRKEWEVLRHHGSFETEVAGMDYAKAELRHSILKFRDD